MKHDLFFLMAPAHAAVFKQAALLVTTAPAVFRCKIIQHLPEAGVFAFDTQDDLWSTARLLFYHSYAASSFIPMVTEIARRRSLVFDPSSPPLDRELYGLRPLQSKRGTRQMPKIGLTQALDTRVAGEVDPSRVRLSE